MSADAWRVDVVVREGRQRKRKKGSIQGQEVRSIGTTLTPTHGPGVLRSWN